MAKEGIDYFPLNCQLDEKFELIEAQFGLKGFAIVVKLLQRIYREHGYYCEWNEDIALLFARQNLSSGDANNLIADIVAASIRRGIFDKTLFENKGILTSRGIQKRYLDVVYKRKAVSVRKSYLLLSDGELKDNVTILDDSDDRINKNDDSFKQSKVKESKVKKNNKSIVARTVPVPATFPDDSFEMSCVNSLLCSCLAQLPGAKVPETEKEKGDWCIHIDRMKRLDRRTETEIREALEFAIRDSFWKTNIRSTKKFREKFETLLLQARGKGAEAKQTKNNSKNRFHNLEEHGYDYDKMVWGMIKDEQI